MSKRETYQTRTILLVGEVQKSTARAVIDNAPTDPENPLELVLRERVKPRKQDQNALMWAGTLNDIAEQAWVNGRRFSAEVWHEYFKREYLPEECEEGIAREGYRKWDYTPDGERVLVGSTTQLTVKGFALYLQQVEAYGASLGVMFHADERIAA